MIVLTVSARATRQFGFLFMFLEFRETKVSKLELPTNEEDVIGFYVPMPAIRTVD